jgi:hypothetical protein
MKDWDFENQVEGDCEEHQYHYPPASPSKGKTFYAQSAYMFVMAWFSASYLTFGMLILLANAGLGLDKHVNSIIEKSRVLTEMPESEIIFSGFVCMFFGIANVAGMFTLFYLMRGYRPNTESSVAEEIWRMVYVCFFVLTVVLAFVDVGSITMVFGLALMVSSGHLMVGFPRLFLPFFNRLMNCKQ